jgi:osmotically-inducible protein OsmY
MPQFGKRDFRHRVAQRIHTSALESISKETTQPIERSNGMVRENAANNVGDVPPLPDRDHMSDTELCAVVRQKLREAAGGTFDLVEVYVRDRRVCLRGDVPSQAARRIALRVVHDEMGLEVADELRVIDGLWKQGEDEPKHGVASASQRPR